MVSQAVNKKFYNQDQQPDYINLVDDEQEEHNSVSNGTATSFYQQCLQKYTNPHKGYTTAKEVSKELPNSIPLYTKKCSINELSPLRDFYSLKNALSDDEDAKYFKGMFANSQDYEQCPANSNTIFQQTTQKRKINVSTQELIS